MTTQTVYDLLDSRRDLPSRAAIFRGRFAGRPVLLDLAILCECGRETHLAGVRADAPANRAERAACHLVARVALAAPGADLDTDTDEALDWDSAAGVLGVSRRELGL